jgi:hypothetical protein
MATVSKSGSKTAASRTGGACDLARSEGFEPRPSCRARRLQLTLGFRLNLGLGLSLGVKPGLGLSLGVESGLGLSLGVKPGSSDFS